MVIPCFNQAHFLDEAIQSVLAQSYRDFEIVVVDDGSTDNTSEIATRYQEVQCIRQDNQGLAGARNTGIRESKGSYLVFLDADDRLLPEALEAGVKCLKAYPDGAFVFGRYRNIAADGSILREKQPLPLSITEDSYESLLQGNYIGMHATVMYRRAVFESVGVFNTSIDAGEDYDLYLRIARKFSFYRHSTMVAEYRHHGTNMTGDFALMLKSMKTVLRSQRPYIKRDKRRKEAYKLGVRYWQYCYGMPLAWEVLAHAQGQQWKKAIWDGLVLMHYYPSAFARAWQKLGALALSGRSLRSLWQSQDYKPLEVGRVRFGDLRRQTPVSRHFGFDRGLPIDRYYIENFLSRRSGDIKGRVLEIKDNTYTRKYGGSGVEVSDVLDVSEDNPRATIVADLVCAPNIPSDTFDCIICTQTLQFVYEVRSAIQTLHRILKPGGILLMTVPGISQIDQEPPNLHWAFTSLSARQLLEEVFLAADIEVEIRGNVLAAISFLQGLAVEDLRQEELDYHDSCYEVLIALRAAKGDIAP